MAEESEKRFHAVMDKLFLAPSPPNSKSNSISTTTPRSTSSTAGGLLRGRKRLHTMATTSLALGDVKSQGSTADLQSASGGTAQRPMCRPWDREDLLKRLATFKSMTWFAKPEVVSAINCARRGWINVDMDTLACESCGTRLFFSTPSTWAQQQVENAASVFSLKLNNGHKLLCPWADNACDEKLAQFPPSSPADLVDSYKKRCASLSQLLELPLISSTAIDYLRSPLLEYFLQNPARDSGDECDEVLLVLYYQAQKLIGLCGWEPRLLPYIVDCKAVRDQSIKDGTPDDSSAVSNANITVYSSRTSANVEANEGPSTQSEQISHSSVVLECRLCGARVGLWAFRTTPRPAEFVRLIGHAEFDKNEAASQTDNTNHSSEESSHADTEEQTAIIAKTGTTSSSKNPLNLTIAGGPPPAEQNFHPTISLPVVGQNLMARFSSAFGKQEDAHFVCNGSLDASGDDNDGRTPVGGDNTTKTAISVTSTLTHPTTADQTENNNGKGKDLNQSSAAKATEFDPILHHRHFCPWISSSGKSAPGWKQTLSALERRKVFAYPSTTQASSSLFQVEDPVGSVKKLLTPPSAKRKKLTPGSI